MKILLCEDDCVVRMIVSTLLEAVGDQVEFASDGQDAFEIIQDYPHFFDVLITDNIMPRLTGVKLVEKLREVNLPIIVILMTVFANKPNTVMHQCPWFNELLIKPFKANDLLRCVENCGSGV
jgi:CheY-like chemotaxis protein